MYLNNKVKDNIYWIGINDRETHLFENYWPLDAGVSYNSYIINDEKVAILDTVKSNYSREFINNIQKIIGNKPVDYVIINHMEPDHSSSINSVIEKWPDVKLIGNKITHRMIKAFYSIENNLLTIEEGDELNLGKHKLKFLMTPMLHWPETMITFDYSSNVLFSMDAFGGFGALNGAIFDDEVNLEFYEDEIRRYYSNIVAKYSPNVQSALKKLNNLPIEVIAPTHGPVWRTSPETIINLYNKWSCYEASKGVVIVYGSMYGNTAKMANYLSRVISNNGIKNIKVFDASKTHDSYILSEIWKYKAVVIGSPTYNGKMFPPIEELTHKLLNTGLKNRYIGIFGNKAWSGGAVKLLNEFSDKMNWQIVGQSVEAYCSPDKEIFDNLTNLGNEIASLIK